MSPGEICQMNDSLADLAIHNPPKICNCDKRCDSSTTRAKKRSCQENCQRRAIPAEVDGYDAERENVLSALAVTRFFQSFFFTFCNEIFFHVVMQTVCDYTCMTLNECKNPPKKPNT